MKILVAAALTACGASSSSPAEKAPSQSAGTFRSPPIIDSHVHLAYWPVADELAKAGVLGAVDLAGPTVVRDDRIEVFASGPMLTRPEGYPLDSWGADGYGIGCSECTCITAAIDGLARTGARVVKLALDDNSLDPALVPCAVEQAHARELKVAVHALSDRSAALAAQAGADVLAHTPIEPLRAETIAAWKTGAVISTLAAFGGRDSAVAKLRALRAAGATILYGTDLGNLREAGPSADEIALLERAGLDAAAILDAMTTAPARFWGFSVGQAENSFIVVDGDPHNDARVLLSPREVWSRGNRLR